MIIIAAIVSAVCMVAGIIACENQKKKIKHFEEMSQHKKKFKKG